MPIRTIRGTVVVITGATSGIGLETARAFARGGAKVVVAGRREERLQELVDEVEKRGGEALAVRTDVADLKQVESLVKQTLTRFDRLDTLVNNAGVGMTALFQEASIEDFRRVMEVNFWGAVYGCKAVVPVMRGQPNGGLIINISSILGKRGIPFETAYCASKFALAGFSEALRTEVMAQGIDVSTIFPGAVESEFWAASSNRTGLELPRSMPMFPARELARIIVQDARFPQPEIVMSLDAQAINFFNRIAPGMMDFFLGQSAPFIEGLRGSTSATPSDAGNLYAPREQQKAPRRSQKTPR